MLEDRASDAELLLYELHRAGYESDWTRVDSEPTYAAALEKGGWELILADYSLPQFDALSALRLLQTKQLDIPFVIVTGSISEEIAVECMKQGASDYLLKDRLARLGQAAAHALDQKRLRDNARLADDALRKYTVDLENLVARRTVELRRAKEHVEAILNHTGEAILLIHLNGTIRQANPAFNALMGYSSDETVGRTLLRLTDPTDRMSFALALRDVIVAKVTKRIELKLKRADGSTFDGDLALHLLIEDGEVGGIVCSLRDITESKQMEIGLRRALQKERELNELKTRFTSMVSHEFRTPLAIIQSASDLLWHYGHRLSDEKKVLQFEEIQQQVRHLTGLLEDILTISRAESVGLQINPKLLNLKDFCSEIVNEIQMTAKKHTIEFRVSGEGRLAMIDPNLMRQAIANILTNAVKYSPQGGRIYFDLIDLNQHTAIRIQDEGIGIPAEDQTHLFEVFHRAENVGNISGSGLGLAIVKRAIDAHQGKISIESEVGKGTTFILNLPVEPVN
jgi:PAS domain S-box-containing protein